MSVLETERVTCPRCNAGIEIEIHVNAWLENTSVVERDPLYDSKTHETDLADCPAYAPEATCIPYSGDLTGFYKPTLHAGEEWWLNGKVVFRGKPLTFMPLADNYADPVSVESLEKIISRVAIGETSPCAPSHADAFRVRMEWEGGSAVTRRSPVDICAHLWPAGTWRVRVGDEEKGERGHTFAYYADEKLMCVQMGIREDR